MLPIRTIVCPIDFSEPSEKGLGAAVELAVSFSAELVLIHVVAPMPAMPGAATPMGFHIPGVLQGMKEAAQKGLEKMSQSIKKQGTPIRTAVIEGNPAHEIVRFPEHKEGVMIVMATHGLSGWSRLLFGSVTDKVVRSARCPVLTIPEPVEES